MYPSRYTVEQLLDMKKYKAGQGLYDRLQAKVQKDSELSKLSRSLVTRAELLITVLEEVVRFRALRSLQSIEEEAEASSSVPGQDERVKKAPARQLDGTDSD